MSVRLVPISVSYPCLGKEEDIQLVQEGDSFLFQEDLLLVQEETHLLV